MRHRHLADIAGTHRPVFVLAFFCATRFIDRRQHPEYSLYYEHPCTIRH